MSWVRLNEFRELSGLSDSCIVWLLTRDKLPVRVNEKGQIQVDVGRVVASEIIDNVLSSMAESLAAESPLVSTRIGNLLSAEFDRVLREALSLFLADTSQ